MFTVHRNNNETLGKIIIDPSKILTFFIISQIIMNIDSTLNFFTKI